MLFMQPMFSFIGKWGKNMTFYERAFRYVQRKKNKTILLFLCFLLVSTLVLCATMILQTAQATSDSIREKTGSKIILENRQGQNAISTDTVSKLTNLSNVTKLNRVAANTALPVNFSPIIGKDDEDVLNHSVTLQAYDDSSADGLFAQEKYRLLKGTHISGHQNGIIVNSYLANTNGLSLGDTLTFKAGTGEIASGEIIGIFFSGMESKQDDAVMAAYRIENQVYVNHELYEKMFPGNGYSSVSVYTSDPGSLSVLYEQASALVDNTITISTSDSLYQQMQAPLKQVIRITTLMLILIIITAVIVISLLLCMWMRTRTKEMAVLISLGFSKWNLFLQAITESLFLFVVSVIGATATNYLFSKSIMNIVFASTDYASLSQTHLTLQHFLTLLFVGGLIVLITVGISIYPTLRANPRDTLSRMEG